MDCNAISTLTKVDKRVAAKGLEKMESLQRGKSSILGSTLIKVLFNTCSNNQLSHIRSKYGILLDSSDEFDPTNEISNIERSRANAL